MHHTSFTRRLLAQLRDMEMAFDGFFEKHHLKLQQYLQLLQYELSFHEVQTLSLKSDSYLDQLERHLNSNSADKHDIAFQNTQLNHLPHFTSDGDHSGETLHTGESYCRLGDNGSSDGPVTHRSWDGGDHSRGQDQISHNILCIKYIKYFFSAR